MFNTGIVVALRKLLGASAPASEPAQDATRTYTDNETYWSEQNVTHHSEFTDVEESLRFLRWRNSNYFDYATLMPVSGQDGKVVVDFGCGPGHDLVGFSVESNPARLIGVDVSQPSLDEAGRRLALHGREVELVKVSDGEPIPLESDSVDLVHSSGVLMHASDPQETLKEFRRILRPGGEAQIMVYNYDCVWFHLFAGYVRRYTDPNYAGMTTREAFYESTDWISCPRNRVWRISEFLELATSAGFEAEHIGNAVAVREIELLSRRFEAVIDQRLEDEHRDFLMSLTFDNRGVPFHDGVGAGIDGCYRLRA